MSTTKYKNKKMCDNLFSTNPPEFTWQNYLPIEDSSGIDNAKYDYFLVEIKKLPVENNY